MSIRDLYNMVLALAAGFLVIATQVFTATTGAWIGFGIAVGATLLSAGLVATRLDVVQRSLTGVAGVIGAGTIVATLVFAPATAATLAFASALALVGLAVVGLTAHELRTERVVHSLQVEQAPSLREREPIAA
jgi:hypothetical protein